MRRLVIAALTGFLLVIASACGSDEAGRTGTGGAVGGTDPGADAPTIVVTYPVLGAAVAELVGDAASVAVVMPDGVDPHDYRPSPRDVEAITRADFVVANGLDLEEGLLDALEQAEDAGVPVFHATDHIEVRTYGADDDGHGHDDDGHGHDDDGHGHEKDEKKEGDDGHGHAGGDDPHFWTDPIAMRDAMAALATELEAALTIELSDRSAALAAGLDELDERSKETLAVIPEERRVLVTGHESMGYFAARYEFVFVGALIPSLTSQASASAAELSALKEKIEQYGVPAIFNELGTPANVAATIAEETGAVVVELPSHTLPADGSYFTFIDEISSRVVEGLSGS
jgi:zinc/manganese transport system substrate-binding protein